MTFYYFFCFFSAQQNFIWKKKIFLQKKIWEKKYFGIFPQKTSWARPNNSPPPPRKNNWQGFFFHKGKGWIIQQIRIDTFSIIYLCCFSSFERRKMTSLSLNKIMVKVVFPQRENIFRLLRWYPSTFDNTAAPCREHFFFRTIFFLWITLWVFIQF